MKRGIGFALVLLIPAVAEAAGWVDLGKHPNAQFQSTAWGQRISTLYGFNNKIYAGYGDYGSNTGPIAIQPYDLATSSFTRMPLTMSNTEAIYLFREIDGVLYAPHTDPKWGPSGSYAYGVSTGSVDKWRDAPAFTSGDVIHAYDMVKYNNALYLAGANGDNAAIYKSVDNGLHWTVDHQVVPTSPGDFMRFYGLVVSGGKLITQADSYYGPLTTKSEVYNGTSWTTGKSIAPSNWSNIVFCQPEVFGNGFVYMLGHPGGTAGLFEVSGSGRVSSVTLPDSSYAHDFKIVGSTFYALSTTGNIYSTSNLNTWNLFAASPIESTSLLYYQDKMYVGTSDSRLLVYDPLGGVVPEPTGMTFLLLGLTVLTRRVRTARNAA